MPCFYAACARPICGTEALFDGPPLQPTLAQALVLRQASFWASVSASHQAAVQNVLNANQSLTDFQAEAALAALSW